MCWAYQEIEKESLPSTSTQCWFSHTQTIDRFIASVVTKMLSTVLEEPISPIAPPSSFTVNYYFPKTFPKTLSNAFMQNSWHTITFELSWKIKYSETRLLRTLMGNEKKVRSNQSTFYPKSDFPHWQDRFHVFTRTICHGRCFSVLDVVHYSPFVRCSRVLGVIIDNNLTWSAHVDAVHSKVARKIGALKRSSRQLTRQARRSFFLTVIQPDLEYSAVACIPNMPGKDEKKYGKKYVKSGPEPLFTYTTVVTVMEASAIGRSPWLITLWYLGIWRNHVNACTMNEHVEPLSL